MKAARLDEEGVELMNQAANLSIGAPAVGVGKDGQICVILIYTNAEGNAGTKGRIAGKTAMPPESAIKLASDIMAAAGSIYDLEKAGGADAVRALRPGGTKTQERIQGKIGLKPGR